jgi:hypothetical protein
LSLFTELYYRQLIAWKEEGVMLFLKHSSTCDSAQHSSGIQKFNHVRLISYHHSSSPM